ncbi:hypothetical protein [Hwanghaeella sp.]|uniref:hypothetical protein n=1 Tax=Hwanghaeella sp. TaxID=2605943 RepID=UPI003CCB90F2
MLLEEEQALAALLARFRTDLAAICGEDLADSLLKAGQSGGAPNLDMQLAINDGLEMMDEAQRSEILGLLDDFLTQAKALRN